MVEDRTLVDLEPYRNGERKMQMRCKGFQTEGCGKPIDITKEYIQCEEQNNIRKTDPEYREACDKLYIFPRLCKECHTHFFIKKNCEDKPDGL